MKSEQAPPSYGAVPWTQIVFKKKAIALSNLLQKRDRILSRYIKIILQASRLCLLNGKDSGLGS
jgi:hypothetical protein